jgi:small subunit ribosomal protein S21e
VQLNVAKVDSSGGNTGQFHTFALAGYIRTKGESDIALNDLIEAADAE